MVKKIEKKDESQEDDVVSPRDPQREGESFEACLHRGGRIVKKDGRGQRWGLVLKEIVLNSRSREGQASGVGQQGIKTLRIK